MIRFLWAMLLAALSFAVNAQSGCVQIVDDRERLDCYDKKNDRVPTQQQLPERTPRDTATSTPAPEAKPEPGWTWKDAFLVRDEGNLNQAGKNPASFSASRTNGADSSLLKAAVVVVAPAINTYGWQPFASVAVNRNTLSTAKSDLRTATLGITGAILDYYETGFAFWPTVSVSAREDGKQNTSGNTALVNVYAVIRGLADGIPFKAGSHEFKLYPRFGAMLEDQKRVATGSVAGTYAGYFGGINFTYWPGVISDRLQLSASYQRFNDSSAPTGAAERRLNYSKVALDFYLFDRGDKNYWIQPVVGIDREVGGDPIGGVFNVNRTTVGIKLKVN